MAAQPATIAPASSPAPAESAPASGTPKPTPKPTPSAVRSLGIPFSSDPAVILQGTAKDKAEDLVREVVCYVIADFKGTVSLGGTFHPFNLRKSELVLAPKWWALSHPSRLVIKE